jgi:hypothetical protein
MEALVHDKPHKCRTYAKHCTKAFCPGHVNRALSMLEILDPHNTHHTHLRGSFLQAQISNQPISHARRSSNSGSSTPHGHSPRHQVTTPTHLYHKSLGNLQDIFHKAANSTQAPSPIQPLHIPPRVQPTPTPSNNTRTVNDKHNIAINKEVEIWDQSKEVEIWDQSPSKNRLVTFNPHNVSDLQVPLHARRITPDTPTPIPMTKPLRRSQRIADLGILSSNTPPEDTPARKTRSQVQARTITQEAILACMNTYSYITWRSLTPANASRCSFPVEILNAVLDKDTGELLEMHHLLTNPKYKDVWGKSYTTELGRLAQGISGVSKGTKTIVFITCNKSHSNNSRRSHMDASVQTIVLKRMTPIARDSPLAVTDSTSPETAERPPSTWSRSSSTSTVSSQPRVYATAPLTSKISTS